MPSKLQEKNSNNQFLEHFSDILLYEGKVLPVMEEFYSIQGEGFNTGQAAYFIRIGGCDVGCHWCDIKESWNAYEFPPIDVLDVVNRAKTFPAKAVVISGGEPLLYNLDYLCQKLIEEKIQTYLETSGSQPMSGNWNWICISPKKDFPPLKEILKESDELKVIIHEEADFIWAEENAEIVNSKCNLFLQPEWSKRNTMMPKIIRYIQEHPKWKISIQIHKYMRIP